MQWQYVFCFWTRTKLKGLLKTSVMVSMVSQHFFNFQHWGIQFDERAYFFQMGEPQLGLVIFFKWGSAGTTSWSPEGHHFYRFGVPFHHGLFFSGFNYIIMLWGTGSFFFSKGGVPPSRENNRNVVDCFLGSDLVVKRLENITPSPWLFHTHTIHVWYIYLHLFELYGKCG